MKLRAEELKSRASQAGLSVEDLARAVERTGLSGRTAVSAVQNWLRGSDHPRCKRSDIERLAAAVGAEPREISRFVSRVVFHRGSPKKAKLVTDLIKGRRVLEAEQVLRFSGKRAAVNAQKALRAAIAEAEEHRADLDGLFVAEARVDNGPHIKRFQPKDRGRAHPILKRTSHLTIGIEERGTGGRR